MRSSDNATVYSGFTIHGSNGICHIEILQYYETNIHLACEGYQSDSEHVHGLLDKWRQKDDLESGQTQVY